MRRCLKMILLATSFSTFVFMTVPLSAQIDAGVGRELRDASVSPDAGRTDRQLSNVKTKKDGNLGDSQAIEERHANGAQQVVEISDSGMPSAFLDAEMKQVADPPIVPKFEPKPVQKKPTLFAPPEPVTYWEERGVTEFLTGEFSIFPDAWLRDEPSRKTSPQPSVQPSPKPAERKMLRPKAPTNEAEGLEVPGRPIVSLDLDNGPSFLASLWILGLLFLVSVVIGKVRALFAARGAVPRVLALFHLIVRVTIFFVLVIDVLRLLPGSSRSVFSWVLVGGAVAFGWSMRDVLPDLLARSVLSLERRLHSGVWISGESFSGTVEHIGLRATWVRDSNGHRIAVPNRELLRAPLLADSSGNKEAEVTIRVPDIADCAHPVRQILHDAVLASPWIFPGAEVIVLRDPDQPDLWRVQAELLDNQFATRFRGELLERFESRAAFDAQCEQGEKDEDLADPNPE